MLVGLEIGVANGDTPCGTGVDTRVGSGIGEVGEGKGRSVGVRVNVGAEVGEEVDDDGLRESRGNGVGVYR